MNEKDIKKIAIEFRESENFDKIKIPILKRFNKIRYGNDVMPFLRFMEWVFGVKNKGLNLDKKSIIHWPFIFEKCESFLNEIKDEITDYSAVILHETLAHRYSDYFRFYSMYEIEFNNHYQFAYSLSKKNNIGLHIDGSAFWNGVAYHRCENLERAAFFYNIVAQNRLNYIDVRMPTLKVQSAFDFFIKHPEFLPKNIKDCILKLEQQNNELSVLVGKEAVIPLSKIEYYKQFWK